MQSDRHFQSSDSQTQKMEAATSPSLNNPIQDPSNGDKLSDSKLISRELKVQLYLALPLIFVNLFMYGMQIVTVMFVGHVSVSALAGAALGYSFVSVTGITVIVSFFSYQFYT